MNFLVCFQSTMGYTTAMRRSRLVTYNRLSSNFSRYLWNATGSFTRPRSSMREEYLPSGGSISGA